MQEITITNTDPSDLYLFGVWQYQRERIASKKESSNVFKSLTSLHNFQHI
jgi:hypothetical protein